MSNGSYYYSENGKEESWGEWGKGLFDPETYDNQTHDEDMHSLESEYRSQGKSVTGYTDVKDENGKVITFSSDFTKHGIPRLKKMLAHADPEEVRRIARHWEALHNELVGGGGDGGQGGYDQVAAGASVVGRLKKAAQDVLEHWEGAAAEGFKRQVDKVITNIQNGATYAHTTHTTMNQVAQDLQQQKKALEAMEEPGDWDSFTNRLGDYANRDDALAKKDLEHGVRSDVTAKLNEENLSAGKEAQLKAASVMEQLATNYNVHAARLKSPGRLDDNQDIAPHDPGVPAPAPIPAPSGSAPSPGTSGGSTGRTGITGGSKPPIATGPRDGGISGGEQVPARTKVDSVSPGITAGGADDISGGGGLRGGVSGGGAGGAGAGGGATGGGMLGGGAAGGAAASRGAMGRGGMGGMGAGSGAGAGRGGITGGSGRGPLARTRGGMAGAPKGITGGSPTTPGGTGLGQGRGGGGMLGGGRQQRPGDKDREHGSRPDYLVEDEETWAPEDSRSVPRNIE